MVYCGSYHNVLPRCSLALLGALLLASGCADKSAIRDQERARYDALEQELISAQEAEERQRRIEMRVAQKLQQMETERSSAALARMKALREAEEASDNEKRANGSTAAGIVTPTAEPVVTQIVVGQSTNDDAPTWSLQDYPSPVDGLPLCAVVSVPVTIPNGPIATHVSVIISQEAIYLRTDATFDTAAPETGYRIDAGIPVAFDRFLNELTAVVDDGYERLSSALEIGTTLRVSFAYSPQLSSAETHIVELSLDSIEKPLSELNGCTQNETESGENQPNKDNQASS